MGKPEIVADPRCPPDRMYLLHRNVVAEWLTAFQEGWDIQELLARQLRERRTVIVSNIGQPKPDPPATS